MIKTVLSSMFAVFLFALGAAGSWYFVQFQEKKQAEASLDSSFDSTLTPVSSTATDETGDSVDMPIPVHARAMSAEEVFRFGAMNRRAAESVRKKEAELRADEQRLQLMRQDIEGQKTEVEGILKQSQSTMESAERMLAQVQQELQTLAAEKEKRLEELEDIKKRTEIPDANKQANIKKMAELLSGMGDTDSAEVLKTLANSGKMEDALRLLDQIEPRDAAKILDALDDPGLVADLTEAYQQLRRYETKPKKR